MAQTLALDAVPPFESALAVIPPPSPISENGTAPSASAPRPHSDEPSPATSSLNVSKPTTLADLAHEVTKWTLHSDHELHSYLKRYSADLFARTKDLEDSVRDIAADADSAHVRLKNTFNCFLMLSNNQFIENRVYDEDQEDLSSVPIRHSETETLDKVAVEPATPTEATEHGTKATADSIVTKYRSALEMGMEALKLFVMMDDDDDDDDEKDGARPPSSPVDTVLDIYNERPLPFIIGTREFLEDETLGLGAAPEEDSDSPSDSSDVSSSSSADASSSSVDASSESRTSTPRHRADSMESDTSGLFGHAPPSRQRADSDKQLTSDLFGRPSARPSASPPLSPRECAVESDDESDASDEREPTQRVATRQDGPQPVATSTLARNRLLDSSDDESDAGLVGSAPFTNPRGVAIDKVARPSRHRIGNSRRSTKPPSRRRSDSFNSSSSDESTVFQSTIEFNQQAMAPQAVRLPIRDDTTSRPLNRVESQRSVSSDSDAESTTSGLFGRPASVATKTQSSSGRPRARPSQRLDVLDDSSSDDEKDGFAASTSAQAKTLTPLPTPVVLPRRLTSFNSSSSSSEDEGLFGPKPLPSATTVRSTPRPQSALRSSQSGLFGEESDDSDTGSLFGSRAPARPSRVDRDSDSDDGVLRQMPHLARPAAVPMSTASVPTTSALTRPSRVGSDSSDSNDSDLFRATPAWISTPAVPSAAQPIMVSRPRVSDDASDDDNGLFGAATPTMATPATASGPRKSTLPLAVAPSGARLEPPNRTSTLAIHPPLLVPAARMQGAASDSDSDSGSDWDNEGGLFGPLRSK